MDGDDGGGGGYTYDDSATVRAPGYNDNCRDDNPFDPTNRNNDPFKSAEDPEEKYRIERERLAEKKETDVDEIKLCDDDVDSTDGRKSGLAVLVGSSLSNSIAEGMAEKNEQIRNGRPYSAFRLEEGERSRDCMQDCVYYGVLCCQCTIL